MKAAKQRAATPASRPRHWVALGAIFILTLLAYSNSFQSGFVLDNKPLILGDARVHAATAENVARLFEHSYWWPTGEAGIHRPITKLTFLLNYAILDNRGQPAGYHAVNFLLHFANVLLVYLLGLRLMRDYRLAAALAGLWAVHPVLTESVTNIVGRADLLAGMSVLGGLLVYLRSAESSGLRRVAWLAALFTIALLGMLSKESAAVLVGVVALYEMTWWRERRKAKALVLGCAVIVLAFLVMWAHRSVVLATAGHSDFPFTDNPLVGADFWTGRLTAVDVMARGLALIGWPAQLSSDYSYYQIPLVTGTPRDWFSWLAMAVVAAGVAMAFRRHRTAFFLACFALLTYLPTSNLLFPVGTIMAERFLYLPSIGVIGCVVLAGHALARRYQAQRWAVVALAVAALGLTFRAWIRNRDWRDELSLATSAASVSPASFKTHKGLALALYDSDQSHSQLDAAIAEIERSVHILDPLPDAANSAETYMFAGGFHLQKGDRISPVEAAAHYRRALVVLNRGDAIVRVTNRLEAERARGNAALPGPPTRFATLYRLLSVAHLRLNDTGQSLKYALYTRELAPGEAETYEQLAASYLGVRDADQAAITLLEGAIITSDASLRDALADLYRGGLDTEGCAGARTLNPACAMVRRHMCAASARAIEHWNRRGRSDLASSVRQLAVGRFGCDALSLNGAGK